MIKCIIEMANNRMYDEISEKPTVLQNKKGAVNVKNLKKTVSMQKPFEYG
jgi:hypothetical protein